MQGSLFDKLDTPRPDLTPDLTQLGATAGEQLHSGLYRNLDLLVNFVDNHDVARVATFCDADTSRIMNALSFVFMWRGLPTLYAGTEHGFVGDHDHNRDALWRTGFATTSQLYAFVTTLNRIRQEQRMALASASIVHVDTCSLVISRGDALFLFVNNRPAAQADERIAYCMAAPLPPPPLGMAWVDALSGKTATFRRERAAHRTPCHGRASLNASEVHERKSSMTRRWVSCRGRGRRLLHRR